ncbi:MAG TPA: 50S ribosomal protein L17 [bacterium (Candidatus Stahlbacteria)]|nr:50S ribosomal protein L17 [Candidatus Stahlbacteria bacterium]
MRHKIKIHKLSRPKAHREALLTNLVKALFANYAIVTTIRKAKEARKLADKLITFAKKGGLSQRRQVLSYIQDKKLVRKLWDEIAPTFNDRQGGYTRITRVGIRKGDGAELALLELVGFEAQIKKKQEELEEKRKERTEKEMGGMR